MRESRWINGEINDVVRLIGDVAGQNGDVIGRVGPDIFMFFPAPIRRWSR
jgi:hypothetical protein